jgi:hypothetical protein
MRSVTRWTRRQASTGRSGRADADRGTPLQSESKTGPADRPDAPHIATSEQATWHLTLPNNGDDRRFRQDLFDRVSPSTALALAKSYEAVYQAHGVRAANLGLLEAVTHCENTVPPALLLSFSDEALCQLANLKAARCRDFASALGPLGDDRRRRERMEVFCRGSGLEPPSEKWPDTSVIARLGDPVWWRRRLRAQRARGLEAAAIRAGLVHGGAGQYASDEAVARRTEQKQRTRQLMKNLLAVNELGEELPMTDLQAHSLADPKVRRFELMARIFGFEQVAKRLVHVAEFYTLTCPSRMHARRADGLGKNPNYDGTIPSQAQSYLTALWSRIRAKLHRIGVEVYGFRIAEPHHDGTPHWHLLLFMPEAEVKTVRGILRDYALRENGEEPGAAEHRFRAVPIDWGKGSAVGYVAKYVSKNIDGHRLESDRDGGDARDAAKRVDTWASTWGIRQFQQIGGPSVSVWRELRRLNTAPLAGVLKRAGEAADAGDWAAYCRLQGGPEANRHQQPIRLHKVWSDKPNRYGEPLGLRVMGVEAGPVIALTRLHEWRLTSRSAKAPESESERELRVGEDLNFSRPLNFSPSQGPVSARGPALNFSSPLEPARTPETGLKFSPCPVSQTGDVLAVALRSPYPSSPPWSSVNNCTVESQADLDEEPEAPETGCRGAGFRPSGTALAPPRAPLASQTTSETEAEGDG